MTPAHRRLADLAALLPERRGELAAILGVSDPTLYGWLRAVNVPRKRREPGYAPPSPEVLAKITTLLERHVADCQRVLAGEPLVEDELGDVGPFHHGPDLSD